MQQNKRISWSYFVSIISHTLHVHGQYLHIMMQYLVFEMCDVMTVVKY